MPRAGTSPSVSPCRQTQPVRQWSLPVPTHTSGTYLQDVPERGNRKTITRQPRMFCFGPASAPSSVQCRVLQLGGSLPDISGISAERLQTSAQLEGSCREVLRPCRAPSWQAGRCRVSLLSVPQEMLAETRSLWNWSGVPQGWGGVGHWNMCCRAPGTRTSKEKNRPVSWSS